MEVHSACKNNSFMALLRKFKKYMYWAFRFIRDVQKPVVRMLVEEPRRFSFELVHGKNNNAQSLIVVVRISGLVIMKGCLQWNPVYV